MGMFDTFKVQLDDGVFEEIQTKNFDCLLNVWYLGDIVQKDLNTYFIDEICMSEKYKNKFIVLIIHEGIFIDFAIENTYELANQKGLNLLEDYISDTKKSKDKFKELLCSNNKEIYANNHKLHSALKKVSAIYDYLYKEEDNIFEENKTSIMKFLNPFREKENKPKLDSSREEKLEFLLKCLLEDITNEYPCYTGIYNPEEKERGVFQ